MSTLTLFFLALGLSMDAFAVSLSNGMCFHNMGKKQSFCAALAFGLFQALMPVIGFVAGRTFSDAIASLDHWVALILLGFIGGKMIVEAIQEHRHPEACPAVRIFTFRTLLLQAIATSIDALAVGISFALMSVNILASASLIGVITFLCCLFGAYLGKQFGAMLKQKAEIFGGCILVIIGVKIFLEHMCGW